MSKKTTPVRGRGGSDEQRRQKTRAAQRSQELHAMARRSPADLMGYLRKTYDAEVVALKAKLHATGEACDYLVCLTANAAVEPSAGRFMGCDVTKRERVPCIATLGGTEVAAMREALRSPPKEGHVWVLVQVPGTRALLAEPFDRSVADVVPASHA